MKSRRLIGWAMIAVEGLALARLSEIHAFPVVLTMAALVGAATQPNLRLRRSRGAVLALGLLVVFLLKWRIWPVDTVGRLATLPADYALAHAFAQYLMVMQVVQFFVTTSGNSAVLPRPTYSFALFGAAAMACAGNYLAPAPFHREYLWYAVIFAVLFALFYLHYYDELNPLRGSNAGRYAGSAAVLALACLGGVGLSVLLNWYQDPFDRFVMNLASHAEMEQSQGFSSRAQLDDMSRLRREDAERVVLRVESDGRPGYLRALAYERYTGRGWLLPAPGQDIAAVEDPPSGLPSSRWDLELFPIQDDGGSPWKPFDVWPAAQMGDAVFLPYGSTWLAAQTTRITVDENGSVRDVPNGRQMMYRAFAAAKPRVIEPSGEQLARYLDIPAGLDPRIEELAGRLTRGKASSRSKMAAIVSHFKNNYTYSLDMQMSFQADPLAHFLLDRLAGHCELFASGAAILLRLTGVPARYVTGFVVDEKSLAGGYWLARNKDAHAWVEAWDKDRREWVRLDPTPDQGIPTGEGRSRLRYAADLIAWQLQKARAVLQQGLGRSIAALFGAARSLLLDTVLGRAILALGTVAAVLYALSRRRRREPDSNPESRAFRRLLRKADRRTRRYGLERMPAETLHRFAIRVRAEGESVPVMEEAAAWYLRYAELRYTKPDDPGAVEELLRLMDRRD